MDRNLDRRLFLKRVAVGTASAGAALYVAACGKGGGGGAALKCDDVSGLTKEEIVIRESLEYAEKSAKPDQTCDNCQLFQAAAAADKCGTCTVMKGPIHPKGWCKSWAAKQA